MKNIKKYNSYGIATTVIAVIVIVVIVVAAIAAYAGMSMSHNTTTVTAVSTSIATTTAVSTSVATTTAVSTSIATTTAVSTSIGTATVTTTQKRASTPIYIADIEELSGSDAISGENVDQAVQFGATQINAAGGIKVGDLNYTLDVVPVDMTSDVSSGPSLITTALSQYNFSAVIFNTDYAYQLYGLFDSAKMPMINNNIEPQENGCVYCFEPVTDLTKIGPANTHFLEYLNGVHSLGTFGLICDTTGFGEAQCPALNQTSYAMFGKAPALMTYVNTPMTAADAAPLVTEVLNAKITFLALPIYDSGDAELIIQTLRADGYTGGILGPGPAYSGGTVHEAIGTAINGLFTGDCWQSDLTPALTNYVVSKTGTVPLGAAGCGYGELYILTDAIIQAGSAKPAAVYNEMKVINISSGPAFQVFGGFGPINFNATNHRGSDTAYFGEWYNNTYHTIWPTAFQKAPVEWPLTGTAAPIVAPIVVSNARPAFSAFTTPEISRTE